MCLLLKYLACRSEQLNFIPICQCDTGARLLQFFVGAGSKRTGSRDGSRTGSDASLPTPAKVTSRAPGVIICEAGINLVLPPKARAL